MLRQMDVGQANPMSGTSGYKQFGLQQIISQMLNQQVFN